MSSMCIELFSRMITHTSRLSCVYVLAMVVWNNGATTALLSVCEEQNIQNQVDSVVHNPVFKLPKSALIVGSSIMYSSCAFHTSSRTGAKGKCVMTKLTGGHPLLNSSDGNHMMLKFYYTTKLLMQIVV